MVKDHLKKNDINVELLDSIRYTIRHCLYTAKAVSILN